MAVVTFLFLLVSSFSVTSSSGNNLRRPLNDYVTHYEHITYNQRDVMNSHYRVRRANTGEINTLPLSFNAFNREFNLLLHPDDQFIDKKASIKDSSGREWSKTHMKSFLYAGRDSNDPSIKVIGNLAFGLFDGKVQTNEETYYIEPSDRYLNDSVSESHSIIYRLSDVDQSLIFKDHPEATPCGATTRTQQRNLAKSIKLHDPESIDVNRNRLTKRQSSYDTSLVRCSLNVIADYKFYSFLTDSPSTQTRIAQATALIRQIIADGSDNFKRQDFNDDSVADGIQLSIFTLTVETTPPPPNDPFYDKFLGPEAYLDAHSSFDYNDYCLSYRFTYRDFAQGVLGLAYVAATGSRGGICDKYQNSKTYNTGMVTLLNYDQRVNNVVSGLTFTHEVGHNFGSKHDPPTEECQPSTGGKYVMFDRANDGSQPNNKNFSPCSRRMMITQIQSKGQNPNDGCFLTAEDDCGNNIINPGEACDCGVNYDMSTMLCEDDPCCNGSSCQLRNQAQCSPFQGMCCEDNCKFSGEDIICRDDDECSLAQTCNGSSAVCPTSEARHSNVSVIQCLTETNATKYCQNGECIGSICIPLGLEDCECTEEDKQCHVCCTLSDGTCESTITIAETNETARTLIPGGMGQVLGVGYPCDNFYGYCNLLNICQLIDTEGSIRRLTEGIFDNTTVQGAIAFLEKYWWVSIIILVVILVGMFIIVVVCHCILPRPKHMQKRAENRKSYRKKKFQRSGHQIYDFNDARSRN